MPQEKASTIAHAIATQQGGAGAGAGPVANAAHVAFISALNEILMFATIVAFVGAVCGLLLVRSRDFAHGTEPATEPAAAVAA